MEAISENIDKVLLEFMDTLSDLYKEQTRLEDSMKAGYLNMSRARYNMGIQSVGIQQCDENKMNASKKVNCTENKFVLENVTDLETQLSDLDIGEESDKSGLRKRTLPQKMESKESYNSMNRDKVEEINLKEVQKKGPFDPLKWFGVLVPQTLRQSQSEFKCSVATAVTVANLKTKLVRLQEEYTALLKQKEEMAA